MTTDEIQLLKESVNKLVEIETTFGERLVARVEIVTDEDENDVHDVMYTMISTSTPEWYAAHSDSGGFVLDFIEITSVKTVNEQ